LRLREVCMQEEGLLAIALPLRHTGNSLSKVSKTSLINDIFL
jgi:hypothetical protein